MPGERQGEAWHALPLEAVLRLQDSGPLGIPPAEAARRLEIHGPNELPGPERRSLLATFVAQFRSPLIYLLFIAAALALLLDEAGDAAVILTIVVINGLIGTLQEGRAERSMAALRELSGIAARVLRGGEERVVPAREIVPGDVLVLAAGDAVPADARVIEAVRLQVAEAALTGESLPVPRLPPEVPASAPLGDRTSMVHAGTLVTAGRGRAVVVATGTLTEIGRIALLTESEREPPTPLERRIARFGRSIAVASIGIFAVVLAAGALRGLPLAEVLMVGISQLVSIVPEGLPVAMTVALAVGMQRMARRRVIVRRLAAVETLGSVTVICSDKTGTLTRNEMTVTAIRLADGGAAEVTGIGYDPAGELRGLDPHDPHLRDLIEAAVLCNDADVIPPAEGQASWRPIGDPTEVALVVLARKAGVDPVALRRARPRTAEVPFDPDLKRMATTHGSRTYVKGAPEAVVNLCGLARSGADDVPLGAAGKRAALAAADELAARALRVLAFAEVDGTAEGMEGRAVLLGVVGEIDPPRPEVNESVASCRSAGVRPVMVTGDHRATGVAIAREAGIAPAGVAIDGAELDAMTDAELAESVERIEVFARVYPAQKLRIVKALQERGHVVAMTGDGVNDAPALARADIGVAMGLTGTEVAKEASRIVITDDRFATIVSAVEEGRIVYRNIKKVILLLLSTGFAEIMVLLLALFLGYPMPFAAVQILWNNVVTEGTITINLAMEPREGDEMRRRPIPRDEPILTGPMLRRLALLSATITAVTLGWFAAGMSAGLPFARVQTSAFTLLAVCEWYNVLNCRSETRSALSFRGPVNGWLLGGLVASVLLQAMVVYAPFMNRIFHTEPLSLADLAGIAVAGSLVLWVDEFRKLHARRRMQ